MTNFHDERPDKSRIILALMSGTSVDSIDAAICDVYYEDDERIGCDVLAFHEHPIDDGLRERIFRVFEDGAGALALACSLNFEIGEAFADAALEVIRKWGEFTDKNVCATGDKFTDKNVCATGDKSTDKNVCATVDAIASHGQTLYHIAPHMVVGRSADALASTLQVGEGAVIAARTGLPVISNFRVADMAVGGNGAPLVPFADFHLLSQPGRGVVVHNLGGIGNCTWLPPSGRAEEVIAFDTGPANMTIDGLVSHFYAGEPFDRDGKHAAAGKVLTELLEEWMAIPYITAPPPKSTGRELFGRQFVARILADNGDCSADDLIATATEFTAQSLVENLQRFVAPRGQIDQLILAGGGARNGYLVGRIRELWRQCGNVEDGAGPGAQTEVLTLDDLGLSVDSKSRECVGFALLGFAHLEGIAGNLPSVTGATRGVVLGDYTPAV